MFQKKAKTFLVCFSVFFVTILYGQVPELINYQGVLTEGGVAVNGTKSMQFEIYDSASAGTLLWSSVSISVSVVNGLYSYKFGTIGDDLNNAAMPFNKIPWTDNGGTTYLQVIVEGTALPNRIQLVSVPYALRAQVSMECQAIVGMIGIFPTDDKTGWLIADGRTIHPTDATADLAGDQYQELYDYLKGDGSQSEFYNATSGLAVLPDLRGYFVRAIDPQGVVAPSGNPRDPDSPRTAGNIQESENKIHNHLANVIGTGSHSHGNFVYDVNKSGGVGYSEVEDFDGTPRNDEFFQKILNCGGGDHTHSVTIDNDGIVESRPNNIAMYYMIKY